MKAKYYRFNCCYVHLILNIIAYDVVLLICLVGKSLTTSVPSMAIRFNATAEEIEEVFTKEENHRDDAIAEGRPPVVPIEKSTDIETSPRRSILPLLGKRSVSVDVNSTGAPPQDSSPPSDPWRFLSDIKGKITKSVEVKFTEYKTRTTENEGSPKITSKDKTKDKQDNSKENSSLSDSEEASESSISKTCGVVSTTEGTQDVDDDTPSLSEEDKQQHANKKETQQFTGSKDGTATASNTSVRQRFRLNSYKSATPLKEGSFGGEFLQNMQKISEGQPAAVPEDEDLADDESAIESGVDALAEINISNFRMDSDNVLNIDEVRGTDIRNAEFGQDGYYDDLETVNKPVWLTVLCLTFYFYLPLSLYASGFIAGSLVISVVWCIYIKLRYDPLQLKPSGITLQSFVEVPSVKEHQPLKKYEVRYTVPTTITRLARIIIRRNNNILSSRPCTDKITNIYLRSTMCTQGWMNEYPEEYNPLTYHVSQTQSVYLRLQGNFLKVSHTRQKIPKRAMWNEPEYKQVFTRHRIYNLQGAKVVLLPDGLAKVR
ncbi:tex2 protein-related [Holotrichia oblita]|uniref:Tex2 protein-related n=1 Tax=Holotrichia oblita TaxID=644536 RepID=A0ACB9SMB5_HOLOL|nr:tex2 protein-related [Holotrichia oblita]